MRRYVWFAFWVLFLLAVEIAVSPRVALGGVSPDWLLILAVFVALRSGAARALAAAWALGMLSDLVVGTRLGLFALGYMLVAGILASVRLGGPRFRFFVRTGMIFVAAAAAHLILAAAAVAEEGRALPATLLLVLTIAFYTALVSPVVIWMLRESAVALRIEPET